MIHSVIGQSEALRVLDAIRPAHVLLIGTPGMGKTHIASWYAASMAHRHDDYVTVDGTLLAEKSLRELRTSEKRRRIDTFPGPVIIDEAHVAKNLEQFYPLVDERPLVCGSDWVRAFIFTTTDEGKLPPALISRLVVISLKQYSLFELGEIAGLAVPQFGPDVRMEIARLCHGSPRRAKVTASLLQEVGQKYQHEIEPRDVRVIMHYLGYPEGLYDRELEIMRALRDGTKSIATLCALLATSRETIGLWETGLIASGLVTISPRGRALTDSGQEVLARVDGNVSTNNGDRTVTSGP